eukprot:COSAG01_NODE_27669_length_680_cov_0.645439_2_plen_63_part_00
MAQSTLAATLYLLMVRACQLSGACVSVERGARFMWVFCQLSGGCSDVAMDTFIADLRRVAEA